jgi:hypothetical protein
MNHVNISVNVQPRTQFNTLDLATAFLTCGAYKYYVFLLAFVFKESCDFEKRPPTICGMLLGTLSDNGMRFKTSEPKEEKKTIRNLLKICKVKRRACTKLL